MADDVRGEGIRDQILDTSTELRQRYEQVRERDMSDPRDLFASTVGRNVIDGLRANNEGFLRSIFTVFEEILNRQEVPASTMVSGIYEYIGGVDPKLLDQARQYMGDAGRRLAHEVLVTNLYESPREGDPPAIAEYYWLGERLVEALPELRDEHDELVASYADEVPSRPGQHVAFDELLNRFLIEQLQTGNTEVLTRIFALLEDMASHEGPEIRNVVRNTVCSYLSGNHPDLVPSALAYMGPNTERLCREIAALLGHPFPKSE